MVLTHHAAQRMIDRRMTHALVLRLVDDGISRHADATHVWASLDIAERDDNLVCAVLVLEDAVVVKTLMHHWQPSPGGP